MLNHLLGDLTTEFFKFQPNSTFGDELAAEIEILADVNRLTTAKLADSKIASIIKKHLNLTINLGLYKRLNASVNVPMLAPNSVEFSNIERYFLDTTTHAKKLFKSTKVIDGCVNTDTGWVSGHFADIEIDVFLGAPLFNASVTTSKRLAAILLHELGHIVNGFLYVQRLSRTSYTMQTYLEDMAACPTSEKRILIAEKAEADLGREIVDKTLLENAKSSQSIALLIIDREFNADDGELGKGAENASSTTSERFADRFVAVHNYETYLAEGLVDIYKYYGEKYGSNVTLRYDNFIAAVILTAIWPAGVFALVAGFFFVKEYAIGEGVYDSPNRRFELMRRSIVEKMKAGGYSDEALLECFDKMIDLQTSTVDTTDIFSMIFSVTSPGVRKSYRKVMLQRLLEDLSASELRVAAARLA